MSHPSPSPFPHGVPAAQPMPYAGRWLLAGGVAAVLGLGAVAVVALLLWTVSPYPDSGAQGALRVAADLWLLGHGAELVRTGGLAEGSSPVGLAPLLLVALPSWLLYRATRHVFEEAGQAREGWDAERDAELAELFGREPGGYGDHGDHFDEDPGEQPPPLAVIRWVCGGYLLVVAVVVGYVARGSIHVDVLSAAVRVPPFVLLVTAVAAWVGCGRPAPRVPMRMRLRFGWIAAPRFWQLRLPAFLRRGLGRMPRERLLSAVRSGLAAATVLLGGGALLTAGALLWHAGATRAVFPQLTGGWSGYLALLLLTLALVPNAAVWAAAYALGPGFTLGAGSVVAPLTAEGYPGLPDFPLLTAVPAEGSGGRVTLGLVCAVPVCAGLVSGWSVARSAVPVRAVRAGTRGWRGTFCTALLAAVCCGVVVALLVHFAGGPLGTGDLAHFGPSWWLNGAVAAGWATVLGPPSALVVRAWRLRGAARSRAGGRTRWGGRRRAGRGAGPNTLRDHSLGWDLGREEPDSLPAHRAPAGAAVSSAGATYAEVSAPTTAGAAAPSQGPPPPANPAPAPPTAPSESPAGGARTTTDGVPTTADAHEPPVVRAPDADAGVDGAGRRPDRGRRAAPVGWVGGRPEVPDSDEEAEAAVDAWHATGARRVRWAAMKEASGGLMADFEPGVSLEPRAPLETRPSAEAHDPG